MPGSVVPYGEELPAIPGREPWEPPRSHLVREPGGTYGIEEGRRPSKALLVNALRDAVTNWRDAGYPGASDVTGELFRYWFEDDHLLADGSLWRYHFGQREAIETLAFLVEVERFTDFKRAVDKYGESFEGSRLIKHGIQHQTGTDGQRRIVRFFPELGSESTQILPPEGLLRYAFKAATGSGKTVVMALIVAWAYFHRARVPGSQLSRNFLILAPNVIVYQRLVRDFASNAIFENLPIIPPAWKADFALKAILRGESAEPSPDGTLFLTNIQQVYERRDAAWTPENAVAALLGRPVNKDLASHERSMLERIRSLPDLIAINDEAHHVHDEDLEWAKTLMALRGQIRLWLDFSATPKDQNGTFFSWIVSDYPLPQAVEDGIVKAPIIVQRVDRADPDEVTADNVVEAYGEWLTAALARWREHREAYARAGQQPVLFIMAEKSDYADRIGQWLVETRELGLKRQDVLIIHTNLAGDIIKGDLEAAREAAATIDDPANPVKVIVSVMMLREGWDVRSVTVVLGLRPFTAKAQILPEQAVGRGLRLMPAVEGTQTLEVMGTRAFEDFVKQLETEGLALPVSKKPPSLPIIIEPIKERARFDIAIPLTRPLFEHSMTKLGELTPEALGTLTSMNDVVVGEQLQFVLAFMTTGSTIGEISVDYPVELPQVSIGRLTELVLRKAQIPGRFAELYPILERYLTEFAFGRRVDLGERTVKVALSSFVLRGRLANEIARRVSELTVEERPVEFEEQEFRLANIAPFAWRRQHVQLERTIFNFVAVYNDYEKRFAEFLASRPDIDRWAALAEQFTRFHVNYLSANGALKRYYPDFLAVQSVDGGEVSWILETKGRVWRDTEYKDKGIRTWCHALQEQTGRDWRYRRVDQLVFDKGQFATFDDLIAAVDSTTPGLFAGTALVPAAVVVASETLLRRIVERLDGAGWLTEPVAGALDPPLIRAVDTTDAGYVMCVFEGQREVSRSEVETLANLRSSSDDATWRWIAISEAGFSADARSVARDHALDLRTEPELDSIIR
jgi:type III restriction enzyme